MIMYSYCFSPFHPVTLVGDRTSDPHTQVHTRARIVGLVPRHAFRRAASRRIHNTTDRPTDQPTKQSPTHPIKNNGSRGKSPLPFLAGALCLAASLALVPVFLAAARANYPGGEAFAALHRHALGNDGGDDGISSSSSSSSSSECVR